MQRSSSCLLLCLGQVTFAAQHMSSPAPARAERMQAQSGLGGSRPASAVTASSLLQNMQTLHQGRAAASPTQTMHSPRHHVSPAVPGSSSPMGSLPGVRIMLMPAADRQHGDATAAAAMEAHRQLAQVRASNAALQQQVAALQRVLDAAQAMPGGAQMQRQQENAFLHQLIAHQGQQAASSEQLDISAELAALRKEVAELRQSIETVSAGNCMQTAALAQVLTSHEHLLKIQVSSLQYCIACT